MDEEINRFLDRQRQTGGGTVIDAQSDEAISQAPRPSSPSIRVSSACSPASHLHSCSRCSCAPRTVVSGPCHAHSHSLEAFISIHSTESTDVAAAAAVVAVATAAAASRVGYFFSATGSGGTTLAWLTCVN